MVQSEIKAVISEGELQFIGSDYSLDDEQDFPNGSSDKLTAKKVIGRIVLSFFTALLLAVFGAFMLCYVITTGPSETVRNTFVLSQGTATKWIPLLFLDEETVKMIEDNSEKVTLDVMSAEEYAAMHQTNVSDNGTVIDEWEGSVDGIKVFTDSGDTFKAYIMLIKDPSRVFVGTSSEYFQSAKIGMNIFDITEKYDVIGGINGGEFEDKGGSGNGARPMGLTYAGGKCVWNDNLKRTFIGFDSNNKLVVANSMTYAEAQALGIRDAVSFQNSNVLIETSAEGNINLHYANSNTGTAQRTAIGQRADGTVIFIVTDGRSASSLGATHNDMIDMMVSLGAVNAAMLDGGSSAMMYYEEYYNVFDDFKGMTLDQYQEKGLVNKYKAFTNPRPIPTYFLVRKGDAQ